MTVWAVLSDSQDESFGETLHNELPLFVCSSCMRVFGSTYYEDSPFKFLISNSNLHKICLALEMLEGFIITKLPENKPKIVCGFHEIAIRALFIYRTSSQPESIFIKFSALKLLLEEGEEL